MARIIYDAIDDYSEVRLTGVVMEEILLKLSMPQLMTRQELLDLIIDYYTSHGGRALPNDPVSTFKHASSMMRKHNADNVYHPTAGLWRFGNHESEEDSSDCLETDLSIGIDTDDMLDSLIPDKIVGDGNESVYMYYYDDCKDLAAFRNESHFKCKIGRTVFDPVERIKAQHGTSSHSKPHIALVIKCDNSSAVENLIHSFLMLQNRHIDDAPGTEWFFTSPDEVLDIYFKFATNTSEV